MASNARRRLTRRILHSREIHFEVLQTLARGDQVFSRAGVHEPRTSKSSAMGPKKFLDDAGAFICQNSSPDLRPMIQPWMAKQVADGSSHACFLVPRAEH